MYIAIAKFSPVPAERDKDFQDWFTQSNDQLRKTPGLKSRRLLRAPDGSYIGLVEHESASTFAAMHTAEAVSMIQEGLGSILSDGPQALTYDVIVDFTTAETCCGDGKEPADPQGGAHAVGSRGCCHSA